MNILLISATEAEIAPLIMFIAAKGQKLSEHCYALNGREITICITGVGMVAAAYSISRALLTGHYDFVLQAGIGGSFDSDIALGEVVFVTSERYGDMGAEDRENFIDVFDLGLIDRNAYPYSDALLVCPPDEIHQDITLRKVAGLTINTVSGSKKTIQRLMEKYGCTTESMEGAALHYVCLMEKVSFAQVRSISNYIEPRDRSKWQMEKAIKNLNEWLMNFLT